MMPVSLTGKVYRSLVSMEGSKTRYNTFYLCLHGSPTTSDHSKINLTLQFSRVDPFWMVTMSLVKKALMKWSGSCLIEGIAARYIS